VEAPQVQTQVQEEEWIQIPWKGFQEPDVKTWRNVEFVVYTWGSCRRSTVDIVHPRRVDLVRLSRGHGEHRVDLGFAVLYIVNSDSSSNMHRYITFEEVREDTLVYVFHSPSCNPGRKVRRAYLLRPDGSATDIEVKVRTAEEDTGIKRRTYEVYYTEYNGMEVELERKPVSEEVVMERLTVKIKRANGKVIVEGDTYHVKEVLKDYGFRWDPNAKAWYRESADTSSIVAALRSHGVNVEVVE